MSPCSLGFRRSAKLTAFAPPYDITSRPSAKSWYGEVCTFLVTDGSTALSLKICIALAAAAEVSSGFPSLSSTCAPCDSTDATNSIEYHWGPAVYRMPKARWTRWLLLSYLASLFCSAATCAHVCGTSWGIRRPAPVNSGLLMSRLHDGAALGRQ